MSSVWLKRIFYQNTEICSGENWIFGRNYSVLVEIVQFSVFRQACFSAETAKMAGRAKILKTKLYLVVHSRCPNSSLLTVVLEGAPGRWFFCSGLCWRNRLKFYVGNGLGYGYKQCEISFGHIKVCRSTSWKTVKNPWFLPNKNHRFLTVFQLLRLRISKHPNEIQINCGHTLVHLPRKISARLAHRGPSNLPSRRSFRARYGKKIISFWWFFNCCSRVPWCAQSKFAFFVAVP